MSQLLTAAKNKYNKDKSVNYDLSLEDFICQSYINLSPNSYGCHIQEKVRRILNVDKVSQSKNMGDYRCGDNYFEFKVSYLSKVTDSYSITHIRPWQKINYYILCFVDCENDFTPNFYLLDKSVISKLKTGYMNGTPDSNSFNTNVELRATVYTNCNNMNLIEQYNLLPNTTLKSLQQFVNNITNTNKEKSYKTLFDNFLDTLKNMYESNPQYFFKYAEKHDLDSDEYVRLFTTS